jgi:hypothetical protein
MQIEAEIHWATFGSCYSSQQTTARWHTQTSKHHTNCTKKTLHSATTLPGKQAWQLARHSMHSAADPPKSHVSLLYATSSRPSIAAAVAAARAASN